MTHDEFPTTIWQDVLKAADPASPESRERLNLLCQRYRAPVLSFIRMKWPTLTETDVEDRAQDFFLKLLTGGFLAGVRPEKGSFRAYLKRALSHDLIDADRVAKRRPDAGAAPLDVEPVDSASDPARALDREWAQVVGGRVREELQRRLVAAGRELDYQVHTAYDWGDGGYTYQSLADELGLSKDDVAKRLRHCKKQLLRAYREEIATYVASPGEVDRELREILNS